MTRSLARLNAFLQPAPPGDPCELCAERLGEAHPHVLEAASGRVLCACEACAILFDHGGSRYRRLDREIRREAVRMSEEAWTALGIPIGLAMLFRRSDQAIALYPSPAGPMEHALDEAAWQRLVQANPGLESLREEVEGLLLHRLNGSLESYRVPIDECHRLIGLVRTRWRGFSGGEEVRVAIERFLASLDERAGRRA